MKIVSANYRDRTSDYPWLIRDMNEHPDQAKAFKSVDATGVKFGPSNKLERGFGCAIVAICDTALGHNDPEQEVGENGTALYFYHNAFRTKDRHRQVLFCDKLRLDKSGGVVAIDEKIVANDT